MTTNNIALLAALTLTIGAMQAATASPDQADERRWEFDVLLDGKPIGKHTFELAEDGNRRVLESKASFDVKFLFVTAFRYRHQSTEIWSDNCLASIDAMTDSNGNELMVRGRRDGSTFEISETDGAKTLPGCVQTFAYWNPAMLQSEQLLNTQTGDYETVTITYEGPDQVPVDGNDVEAVKYALKTQGGDIKLWYSADDRTWLALEAPAKGGRTLAYRPTRVPLDERDASLLARRD